MDAGMMNPKHIPHVLPVHRKIVDKSVVKYVTMNNTITTTADSSETLLVNMDKFGILSSESRIVVCWGKMLCLNGIRRSGSLNKFTRERATLPESSRSGWIDHLPINILEGMLPPLSEKDKYPDIPTKR
jgi:hypothetical protein